MAGIVPARHGGHLNKLKSQFPAQVDVPPERGALGLEANEQAMDSRKPGDVVILAAPPGFRWCTSRRGSIPNRSRSHFSWSGTT
jgi:hypothetical protein